MKANFPVSIKALSAKGLGALALIAVLGSCAAPPPPAPTPAPLPAPRPRPAPPPVVKGPADWRDAPATAGDWRWGQEGGRSVARYGPGLADTRISLSCDPAAHVVTLSLPGIGTGPEPLTVTTTSLRRVLNAAPALIDPPTLQTQLAAADPLLDAMAFSRGRLMVEAPGFTALYLPSWPEVSRVIEDCR